jgi:multiple sugar transport system substrate-binding protein
MSIDARFVPSGLRTLSRRRFGALALGVGATAWGMSSCAASSPGPASNAARGPITAWYSNNVQEVTWGEQMVSAWNKAHPDEAISAQQLPSGKSSEEVVSAAITAGNAPGLILNISPASVAGFVRQGGLVPLSEYPGADDYIRSRTGSRAEQYVSADGKFYQLPWKSNPVMIFYNKALFTKAGLDPDHPKLATYAEFLDAARTIVAKKVAQTAIWPSPSSEWYQAEADFYPLYAAATGGTSLIRDGRTTYDDAHGRAVADFYRTLYAENLASPETTAIDTFASGEAAMAIVGPWAIASYKGVIDWGAVPVPSPTGTAAAKLWTYSDAKNISLMTACTNRATAWDVIRFATSSAQDSLLLSLTGQMPLRQNLATTYAPYFAKNPDYALFSDQAARTSDVPNVDNGIQVWQTFRDAWGKSVIFGEESVAGALESSARQINSIIKEA